jgi:hypothetical protein
VEGEIERVEEDGEDENVGEPEQLNVPGSGDTF